MQFFKMKHEFPSQNANDGWEYVQLNPPNENQGWRKPISPPTRNVASQSSSESPHSDDLPHKQPSQPANLKVFPIVVSTNVDISVELVGLPFSHVVDNPASGYGKQIDLEHPTFHPPQMLCVVVQVFLHGA